MRDLSVIRLFAESELFDGKEIRFCLKLNLEFVSN